MTRLTRRDILLFGSAAVAAPLVRAQERGLDPQPGAWRTFDMTTRVDPLAPDDFKDTITAREIAG